MVLANKDLWAMVTRYPGLTVPVGILFGGEDRILDPRAHAWAMKDAAPAVEIEMTDGGHMLPIIAPERCAAFIRKVDAQTAERSRDTRPGAA
jgi:pimeloyl-ACP methyl ester carboxylesterase